MFALPRLPGHARPVGAACLALCLWASHAPDSQAALSLSGTRVVFDSDKRNVSLTVTNPSAKAFAVQAWVNTEADDQTTAVPFIASPPLFRLNAGKEQQIQINGLPNQLPRDRESLFYFNVQEIPQAESGQSNQLNIALRTRIKLFYRPGELRENPLDRLKDLRWSIDTRSGTPQLRVNNPSPFHVSFVAIEVSGNGQRLELARTPMVAPLSSQNYALGSLKPGAGLQVKFSAITDYGGYTQPMTLPISLDR